ncbi:PucR family transcriptional regulator [Nitriliruptoraceae bacterium ZYF776]|nr:PucR family transcriptional regulator [Profundirhabdus halotolerans]
MEVVPLPPPRDDALVRAVAGRLVAHLDDLLPELGATYRREIEGYARLSDAALEAQVLATSRRLVEGYFGRLAAGRDPARVDLTAMELVGRRRLEMGLSLDDALHAFRLAAREVWRALAEAVAPGEEAALVPLASGWIERLDQASSRVATGYLEASHDRLRRQDARRHDAVDALLGADDDGEVAAVGERHAIAIAPRYLPVVLVGDRVLGRADAVLAAVPDALVDGRGERLLVLLPADPDAPPGVEPPDPTELAGLTRAVLAIVGQPVVAGNDLAEQVRVTQALADLELDRRTPRSHRTPRVVAADERPLERVLVAAGPAASHLVAARLAPLADRPELRATLDAYLDLGAIPEVAAQLGVHPNTVAHRLRRVRDLTGLDPRVPRQAAVLTLAATADPDPDPDPGADPDPDLGSAGATP